MALPKLFTTNGREQMFLHDKVLCIISIAMGLVYLCSISKDAQILIYSVRYELSMSFKANHGYLL